MFLIGDFFLDEGLVIFMTFSGDEAEYVDILPFGMVF